jgi:hypothetical protein
MCPGRGPRQDSNLRPLAWKTHAHDDGRHHRQAGLDLTPRSRYFQISTAFLTIGTLCDILGTVRNNGSDEADGNCP